MAVSRNMSLGGSEVPKYFSNIGGGISPSDNTNSI